MSRGVMVSFMAGCVLLAAMPAFAGPAEKAAKVFGDGKALLAKSDFDGALEAFKKAARTDPRHVEYRRHYAILRQVISMRRQLEKEKERDRWVAMAAALRVFYYDHDIYVEALLLDRENYKRHPGGDSAAILAETQLALGKNAEAAKTVSSLSKKEATTRVRQVKLV